ncbi:CI-B8 domain-containing protein [Staphylotrichum tortipilum]|uniref:CI-B8 domain-containing protein n=1 Tax=Staphylotrichum tortipilum TaxID=2831512 RepID=A0AAN6MT35_9PEZI|nr:CI-B8 domain-containing protein [Staphylotrichum longicolle]
MTGPLSRTNKLAGLVRLRSGPGAAILPHDVTRIHLEFNHKYNGGHMGPRKFWREALPGLKFWNPAVPMVVNRSNEKDAPATLTLYFREAGVKLPDLMQTGSATDGTSKAPAPVPGERAVQIHMKNRRSEAILKEFMDKSGAVPVKPTPQDELELRELADREAIGEIDRAVSLKQNEERRKEEEFLRRTRAALADSQANM